MSPKSRGRPAGRGSPKARRQMPARSLRPSDRLVRAAQDLLTYTDPLEAERWASGWLGQAWLAAPLGAGAPTRSRYSSPTGCRRKAFLDADGRLALPDALRGWLRFALERRGVADEWITPVTAAVDTWLPQFEHAVDDETSWGPAKQIAAELKARGVDPRDSDAVDEVIGRLNAEHIANRLRDSSGGSSR
nr:hypothetical protein GCM10020063_084930 [Dactylosporangium thailandense]